MGVKIPKIPRPRTVVHLHYLEHFGASAYSKTSKILKDAYPVSATVQ